MTESLLSQESLARLAKIAASAGEQVMRIYEKAGDMAILEKVDQSPLTEADLKANEIICEALAALTPDIPVLSEESRWTHRRDAGIFWAVDPLDGTKEFIRRNGEFTVNIALVDSGVPRVGVICAPALNELWGAICPLDPKHRWVAKTSTSRGAGGEFVFDWQPIGVSSNGQINSAHTPLRLLSSRSHGGDEIPGWLRRLIGDAIKIEKGSSLKFCWVAEGKADLYVRMGPTCIWDTAAGHAILTAAGGAVVHSEDNSELSYRDPTKIVNPSFIAYSPERINFSNVEG